MDSIDHTRGAMSESMDHVNETEEVVNNIRVVAGEIGEGNNEMDDVISQCRDNLQSISDTIDQSQVYYEEVENAYSSDEKRDIRWYKKWGKK